MEEFKSYKLSEVAVLTTGFPFDGSKYSKSGIRVVRGDNVTIGSLRWDSDKLKCWSEPFSRTAEYSLQDGDIVIGMDGSRVGRNRAQISKSDLPLLLAQRVACIRHNEKSVQDYLYYLIFNERFVDYVKSVQTGTSIPHISLKQIGDFEVKLPSIERQKSICDVLKSLDEKIAINNRINHNLEEQADCLLSSAIETQANGSAHLRDICSYVSGKVNCDTLINENYISTDNMFANRGGVGIASTIPEGKCTSFMARDILVSNIRPYFKKVWRASFSGGCSNDVLCFRSTTGTSSFLYHLIRSDAFFDYVMSGAKGSKMPRGDKQHIMNWEIPLFENGFIASLEDSLKVIDDRVAIIQEENRRLNDIRDSLLPMLMNNRVSINGLTC